MLSPRLSECTECSSISQLLDIIDCKLTELAKNEYNNIIFSLNLSIQSETFGDLLNYKRILTNKLCNYDYACAFSLSAIASRVKVLTGGLTNCCVRKKAKPSHYIPIVPSTTTTTTTLYCANSGFWYNTIAPDESSPYYPESMEIDAACNIYSFSQIGSTGTYRKFDSSGTLVWENTFLAVVGGDIFVSDPSEMKIDSDGNLYMVYNRGIRKVDPDGIILWEEWWELGVNIIGINFDNDGNLFASISGNNVSNNVYLAKLSASTGTVIAQKEIIITGSSDTFTNNAPLVDSLGNVLVAVANNTSEYFTTIIKFTNDLSTVIWDARLDQADFNKDCDITGFQIDANDNVYGCNFGSSIFKLSSNGTFAWARTLISCEFRDYNVDIFALAVSPEGDVFWVGSQIDFEWCGTSNDNSYIVINKFDTNGVYKWSTAIGQPNPPEDFINIGSWNYSQDAAKIRNGILMIVGWNEDNYDEYLFKLPLNQVTPGTYGDLDFLDITSYLTSQTITSTILTSTYTVSNSTILDGPESAVITNSTLTLDITNTIIP